MQQLLYVVNKIIRFNVFWFLISLHINANQKKYSNITSTYVMIYVQKLFSHTFFEIHSHSQQA